MKKHIVIAAIATAVGLSAVLCTALLPISETNPLAYDASVFRTGDILFVRGTSWRSYVVVLLDKGNSDFSHVGLIRVEKGVPYVIHATPNPSEGPESGSVISEALNEFLASKRITQAALYRLRGDSGGVAEAATIIAEGYAARATPFDHEFSLSSAEKLYCTELIWLAYKRAGLNVLDRFSERNAILLPSALSQSHYLTEIARF